MSERDERVRVNQSLAWVGAATAVMGVVDIFAKWLLFGLWITPEEYGVATLALVAIPLIDLATEGGLPAALVQQGDHTETRLSTVFWLNLAMSLVVIALLFFGLAPALARRYDAPIVGWILQAHCVKLALQNVYMMPGALMIRGLRFREFSLVRVLASAADSLAMIVTAPYAGIWCFVAGSIARVVVMSVGIQWYQPWRPRLLFDWGSSRGTVYFGLKTSLSRALFFTYTGVDFYVVGEYFGREALGLYRAAADLALDPARILTTVVVSVAFPAFARARDNAGLLVEQFLKMSRLSLIIVAGFHVVVVPAAPDLLLLLDERWAMAAPAVRVLAIAAVLRALSVVVPPLLDGIGRPSLTLVYMAVAAAAMPLCFLAAAELLGGVLDYLSVAWAWVLGYPIAFAVLLGFALRHLRIGFGAYLGAIARLVLWTLAAIAVGTLARALLLPLVEVALARALLVGAVGAGALLALLAAFEGITPRSVAASLRRGDK